MLLIIRWANNMPVVCSRGTDKGLKDIHKRLWVGHEEAEQVKWRLIFTLSPGGSAILGARVISRLHCPFRALYGWNDPRRPYAGEPRTICATSPTRPVNWRTLDFGRQTRFNRKKLAEWMHKPLVLIPPSKMRNRVHVTLVWLHGTT